ncbi:MAG: hypothetical protein MRJ93_03875 [Nitrososphaeraceae archaeon]|nr:hypothetical protein [Nitrososphaeraceae archaeon]
MKDIIHKIENTKNDIEKDFALVKDKIGLTSADLDWYSNIKEDLEKEDMPVEDFSFLTGTIKTIKKYSTKNVFGTLQKINEIENLDK